MSPISAAKILAIAVAALTLTACGVLFPPDQVVVRYRETISYEVGGRALPASGIFEVMYREQGFRSNGGTGTDVYFKGTAFELTGITGRRIFVSLRTPYLRFAAGCGISDWERLREKVKELKGPCKAAPREWPMLVDVNAPVSRVWPDRLNLDGQPAAHIVSIEVQRTADPLTTTLDQKAVAAAVGKMVRKEDHDNGPELELQAWDFQLDEHP